MERPKEIDTIDESSIHRRSDHSVDGMDSVGWTGFEPFLVMLDDPKKFTTLMDKEQFLYDLAQSKQEALLHAWSIRQSTGGDCLEAGTRKVLSGTKVEHINEQEGFVLRRHEKVGDRKNVRNENSDSDEDSDNNSAQEDLEDLKGDEETGENNGKQPACPSHYLHHCPSFNHLSTVHHLIISASYSLSLISTLIHHCSKLLSFSYDILASGLTLIYPYSDPT